VDSRGKMETVMVGTKKKKKKGSDRKLTIEMKLARKVLLFGKESEGVKRGMTGKTRESVREREKLVII